MASVYENFLSGSPTTFLQSQCTVPCMLQVPQPLSVLIHICSELDLMLPVTLLSVPNLKMGTCASGRTRKESFIF